MLVDCNGTLLEGEDFSLPSFLLNNIIVFLSFSLFSLLAVTGRDRSLRFIDFRTQEQAYRIQPHESARGHSKKKKYF